MALQLCTPKMLGRLLLILFGVVMTLFYFAPRLPEAAACVTLNQSVTEAPWVTGLGCAFHTNQERTCTTCAAWPYQCCQPDKLVDSMMCWQAYVDIQIQDRPNSPVNNLALVCDVDVMDCMLSYRRMVTPAMTFECHYTRNDARPKIGHDDTANNMIAFWIFIGCLLGVSFVGSCNAQPEDIDELDWS